MILTTDNARYLLPYLKAYAEGKIVKGKMRCTDPFETLGENSQWERFCELKIEDPPREYFIDVDEKGCPISVHTGVPFLKSGTVIKVREVKEETPGRHGMIPGSANAQAERLRQKENERTNP